jgi:hypothetical protein
VLEDLGEARGGHILLISDGIENKHPNISQVKPTVMDKGVIIHSILYSDKADKQTEALSKDSCGTPMFDSGQGNSTDLLGSLLSIGQSIAADMAPSNLTAFSSKATVSICQRISCDNLKSRLQSQNKI